MKTYDKYKETEYQWIGSIPINWETKRIKFVCSDIFPGATPSTDKKEYWDGNIPWVPSGCCHDCDVNEAPKYITELGLQNSSTRIIPANTTIIALTGATCAQLGYLTINSCANQSVVAFVENKKKAYSKFLFYALRAARSSILTSQTGGAQAGINVEDCKNIILAFPPLEEQRVIADFLDAKTAELDKEKENLLNQMELLKVLKSSVITKAVSGGLRGERDSYESRLFGISIPKDWTVKQLKFALSGIQDGTHGTFERIAEGKLLLSAKNIAEDGIEIGDNEAHISEDDYRGIISNGYPQKGDIAICCVGTIGRCCLYEFDQPLAFQRSVTFLRPNRDHFAKFLLYVLRSNLVSSQLEKNKKTATISGIYMGDIAQLMIPVPPLAEQKQIATYLDSRTAQIDEQIALQEQQIQLIEELKQSIISQAVTGKIKVI